MDRDLRARALRLLARREHSTQELATKLAGHAESSGQLSTLLDDLSAASLLSDERYAATRVASRAVRFGNARVAYELRQQGVAEELVSNALAGAENELVRARRVWRKRFGERPVAGDATEYARQFRFLAGRGFSAETVARLLRAEADDH
ncbi:MAG: recombination regulator RecX [Elusimicrobia bacterium]|nr:MAG: recombination regulator RecX [Elusimicrobiota bacterium]